MTHLILVRGLPGSGKSTFGERMTQHSYRHYEADMYFINEHGHYVFCKDKIGAAHKWCLDRTKAALLNGFDVIVTNTFSRLWELKPYLELDTFKQVITMNGNYGNIHTVPSEVIDAMRARWEPYE